MSGAKDVIDEIRRTEFLLDVELSPDALIGARNVRAKLHRALRLLSEELYSRDTHFVLELVQNADDNHYSALDVPGVSFELFSDRLEMTNNEMGFAAENVRALCDVGNSTKAKRDGFIGEKGIGFKSVFAISDRPEIHSNDFHFRFDTTVDDLLGYVVPIWLDGFERQDGTKIVLPAKVDHPFTPSTLSELSAQLLLFLRKLRRLEVRNAISQSAFIAERMDQGHRLTLTSTSRSLSNGAAQKRIVATYLRVEHNVSTGDLEEEKRPDIQQTQVILAFRLNEDGTARADMTHPVFAFLPVRDVGFKFVLQADFLLSSSREDVHKNSLWNIRIRDAIADAFVSAVPHFTIDEQLARTFLHYVPDDFDIVDDFFRETAARICALLRETACVQSRSGRWCTPSQILLADADFQSLFSNDDLQRCLQLEYPMQGFTPSARTILGRLGAPSASLSHTLALLQDEAAVSQHSADWFSTLYDYLARTYPAEQSVKKMRVLACVRVNGGTLKSASKDEIFFPLSRGKRYGFEQDLDIVDREVLGGPKDRTARVREFLANLGVHDTSPYELIENHILPQHAEDEWKASKLETLAGHVAYIKDHLTSYVQGHIANAFGATPSTATARLRQGLYIQSKNADDKHTYFSRPYALYLPSEYSPGFALEEFLGASVAAGLFVAATYLAPAAADQAERAEIVGEWRDFFYRIGVNQFPTVSQVTSSGIINFQTGAELKGMLASTDDAVVSAAFRLIDRNWRSYYGQFRMRKHASGSATTTSSSFVTELRQTLAPTIKKGRVPICEAFLNADALHVVFGKSPPYLAVDLRDEEFMDALGITHKIDAAACVRRLDQLRQATRVTTKELRTLYTALEGRLAIEPSSVTDALTRQPRIYAPNAKRWCAASEVVWESTSALLDSLYPPLDHAYPEHRLFFCKHLEIAKRPSEDALVSALQALPKFDASPEQRQREAYTIYRRLNAALREARESDPEAVPGWLGRLRTEDVFLDHAGRLVASDNDLYIDDQPKLADLFKQHPQISLIPIERAHLSTVRMLLDACRIPTVMDRVQYKRLAASDQEIDHSLSKRVRGRAQALMRLFFHRHHRLFEDSLRNGVWAHLSLLEIVWVGELTVEATLADYAAPFSAEILRTGHTIYARRDLRVPRDKLCMELCVMLGAHSDVADAIHRVIFADTDDEVEQLFENRGIEPIPRDELARLKGSKAPLESVVDPDSGMDEEELAEEPLALVSDGPALAAPTAESSWPTTAINGLHSTVGWSTEPTDRHFSGGSHSGTTTLSGSPLPVRDRAQSPPDDGQAVISGETGGGSTSFGAAPKRDRAHSSGRLLSYAEPRIDISRQPPEEAGQDAELRREIASAAVSFVIERERQDRHQVHEMPFNNEGFDLQRTAADGSLEYIEVKGQSGLWTETGIALTPAELQYAQRFRERYFLYVVEFANDPNRRTLYRIQDPFGKVMQFRFDSGWKGIATTSDIVEPAVGLKIQLEEAVGTIVGVRRAGQFFSLQVQVGEDAPKTVLFTPGKMQLLSV